MNLTEDPVGSIQHFTPPELLLTMLAGLAYRVASTARDRGLEKTAAVCNQGWLGEATLRFAQRASGGPDHLRGSKE